MSRNILHICSYYDSSTTYQNQFNELSKLGVQQTVYIPIQQKIKFGKNRLINKKNINFIYSPILNIFTRLSLAYKTQIIKKDIFSKISLKQFDIIHAHSLFSDGSIAKIINNYYHIPFIVSVRSTDINGLLRLKPYLSFKAKKIMNDAKHIIPIAPWINKTLIQKYLQSKKCEQNIIKIQMITNPIDSFWIENRINIANKFCDIRLIYVGDSRKIKNIPIIINAVVWLNKKGTKTTLTLIGSIEKATNSLRNLIKKHNNFIIYKGKISSKKDLMAEYRNANIFIMASFTETFGLVYLEALSQGLPVIYSKNTGIDGLFNDGQIGYSVNPHDVEEVANAILKTYDNYNRIVKNTHNLINAFHPEKIVKKLYTLYK